MEDHNKMGGNQEGTVKEKEKEKEKEKTDEKEDEEIEENEKGNDLERTIDDDVKVVRTLSKSNMEELVTCYFTVLNTTERQSPPVAMSPYPSISRMGSNSNTRCPTRSGSGSALESGYKENIFNRISVTNKCDDVVDNDGVDLEKDAAWRRHSIVLDYAPTPRPASPSPSSPPSTQPNSRTGGEEGNCPVAALLGSEKDFGFANGDEIFSKLEAIKVKSDSYELRRLNGEEKEDSESETETKENGEKKEEKENQNENKKDKDNETDSSKDKVKEKEKEKEGEKEKEKERERDKGEKMKWNPTALLSSAPIPVSKNTDLFEYCLLYYLCNVYFKSEYISFEYQRKEDNKVLHLYLSYLNIRERKTIKCYTCIYLI